MNTTSSPAGCGVINTGDPHFSRRILALDLATVCGWASIANGVTTSGAQDFSRRPATKGTKTRPPRPADHPGAPFARFESWLVTILATETPDAIAYEEVCRWGGYSAAHCFGGYRGAMLAAAARRGIPCHGYTPGEVKKFWTGNGSAKKPAMIAEAVRRFPGIQLSGDDEADALAILQLHLSTLHK